MLVEVQQVLLAMQLPRSNLLLLLLRWGLALAACELGTEPPEEGKHHVLVCRVREVLGQVL